MTDTLGVVSSVKQMPGIAISDITDLRLYHNPEDLTAILNDERYQEYFSPHDLVRTYLRNFESKQHLDNVVEVIDRYIATSGELAGGYDLPTNLLSIILLKSLINKLNKIVDKSVRTSVVLSVIKRKLSHNFLTVILRMRLHS